MIVTDNERRMCEDRAIRILDFEFANSIPNFLNGNEKFPLTPAPDTPQTPTDILLMLQNHQLQFLLLLTIRNFWPGRIGLTPP